MLYQFDTESLKHAKAALLLYAMYRSRSEKSALNGLETWDRFGAYIKGACLKSVSTAEFVQNFCAKAKIESVKPKYLYTGGPVVMPETGELISSDSVKDYQVGLFEDNSLLPLIERESMYLIMLVRERIQRDKMQLTTEVPEDENED